ADPGRERRARALPGRGARDHLRGAARAVRLDQGAPRGRAARLSAARHLLLRLQPPAPPVPRQPEAPSRALARRRPRQARAARTAGGRAAGLGVGAARGRSLHLAVLRLSERTARRAPPRGAAPLRRVRLLPRAPAALRAALQLGRGA